MDLTRGELRDSVRELLADTDPHKTAVGENFVFEENTSDPRRDDFEAFDLSSDVRELADAYFRGSIQGNRRGHLPSTFDFALNAPALLPETIERNQKIVRLERIDRIMDSDPALDIARLEDALRARNSVILSAFTDLFHTFPGERPAFVAFKSELADDLRQPDWLNRMIERLGLLHYFPLGAGDTYHFALMEYMVDDVFKQTAATGIAQPFALATVLECRNNPAFFPVPRLASHGFTLDLAVGGPRAPVVREVLHARIDYVHKHVVRFGKWSGPKLMPDLAAARERHVAWLHGETGRGDFGVPLPVGP